MHLSGTSTSHFDVVMNHGRCHVFVDQTVFYCHRGSSSKALTIHLCALIGDCIHEPKGMCKSDVERESRSHSSMERAYLGTLFTTEYGPATLNLKDYSLSKKQFFTVHWKV